MSDLPRPGRRVAASVRDMQNRKWACTLMGTRRNLEPSWSRAGLGPYSSPFVACCPLASQRPRQHPRSAADGTPPCAVFRHPNEEVGPRKLIMTAISINRIGEPVPSHSIKVQAQPEAIVAPDCVPRNAMRLPPSRTARLGSRQIKKTNSQKTKRKRA